MARICVIGSGPIGIEFAISAVSSGCHITMLEMGPDFAANVRKWEHVRLFSAWNLNMSETGKQILISNGISLPNEEEFPTGMEFIENYLQHLMAHLSRQNNFELHTMTECLHIGRGILLKGEKIANSSRNDYSFRLYVRNLGTSTDRIIENIDYVIDCSGTLTNPNFFGIGGIPALGELNLRQENRIVTVIPNFELDTGLQYLNKASVVIGCGYSAITTINHLKKLSEKMSEPVKVIWITRHGENPYQRIENDSLPQRDLLSSFGNVLSTFPKYNENLLSTFPKYNENLFLIEYIGNSHIRSVSYDSQNSKFHLDIFSEEKKSEESQVLIEVDHIISNVGYKPNLEMYRELQVHQCYATEGPIKLAASILSTKQSAGSDCLKQQSPSSEVLKNPEPHFFIIGMKSYGRSSSFLLKIGHEQVQNVIQLILAENKV